MSTADGRLAWLDIGKGLGIILVVTGHVMVRSTSLLANDVAAMIYLFHMPLFFVLAGMTLKLEPLPGFARRKALALLLPYGFFLALLGLPSLALSCGFGLPVPDLGIDRCAVMAAKLLLGGSMLGGIFGTFWFIPCLFFALVVAQIVVGPLRHQSLSQRAGAVCALAIMAYALPLVFPLATGIVALGAVPMASMLVLAGHEIARRALLAQPGILLLGAIAGVLTIAIMAPFDMKYGSYGIPILGAAGALALCTLMMKLAMTLERWPAIASLLQAIGQKTLTILYLHQAIHLGLRQAGLHHEGLLILLSLAIPLLLHRPAAALLATAATWASPNLSRKSPSN